MPQRPRLTHGAVVPQVEAVLRGHLAAGRWTQGQRLPNENELATELGVGRSSVREAVRLLARDGLLEVRHGAGTFVSDGQDAVPDVAVLLRRARMVEVYEIRRALEVEAARLAARRARPDQLAGLHGLLERRAANAANPERFVRTDFDFHQAVVDLSGNTILIDLFRMARPIIEAALIDRITADGHLPDTGDEHEQLLAALERGDPEAAVAATERNLGVVLDPAAELDPP